jgi:hypothetical protein
MDRGTSSAGQMDFLSVVNRAEAAWEAEGQVACLALAAVAGRAVSLISSLIQLHPETFGVHHAGQAAEVTDPLEPRRTHAHRLGKRAGASSHSRPTSSAAHAPGVRPRRGPTRRGGARMGAVRAAAGIGRANGFANNGPGPPWTQVD